MPRKKGSPTVPKTKPVRLTVNKILKERKKAIKLSKERAKTTEEMKDFEEMLQKEVKWVFNEDDNENSVSVSPKFEHDLFDASKFNIPFDESTFPDITEACSQRFLIMSIELGDLYANIHYNNLMNAGWSPELKDIRSVLNSWDINLDSVISKPLEKREVSDKQVERHNFELVMNYIAQSIHKNNKFSDKDLLTLAKFAVAISFDHYYGQMINVIKSVYNTCIQTALNEDNETDIIAYVQEMYSEYEEVHLLKIMFLFLPMRGKIMKKIYTYLTFKLYRSLLGKTECIFELPTNINEWFVQDLVTREYFINNPNEILKNVIHLLEHVVVVFDLYKEEEKLRDMYDFLHSLMNPTGSSQHLLNILDIWKLKLFRKHVNHKLNSLSDN